MNQEQSAKPVMTIPTGSPGARIMSIGADRPERVVTNDEICEFIDSSDQWIRERSGIVSRRFAAKDESVLDMAEKAGRLAIERSGLAAADIDLVVVATVTYPWQTPAAATILADRLGTTPASAFDLGAACSGFCYALGVANDMIRAGSARHVLLVGVEKLSDFTDLHDRGSAFIFADGAGAVVIGPSPTPDIGPTISGADGAQWEAIRQTESWVDYRDSGHLKWPTVQVAGQTVFRWAVWQMPPVAHKAVEAAGLALGDLDVFIPHQANMRIIDAMVKRLQLPPHVAVARDIADTGNTSAASVPLAMERILADGKARSGDLALLIGFGAGLAYAAQVVVLP